MSARDLVRAVPDLPEDNRDCVAVADGALFEAPPRRGRSTSGRIRHEEKITVYLSAGELHEMDAARLILSHDYGLKVDRGRAVREAVAMLLADFEERGPDSVLVRRLRAQ